MNAKQFLSRGRWIEREITSLIRTRDETRDRLTHITQNYDSDGAQTTKDPHKFDSIAAMEDMIDREVDRLYDIKQEILSVILQLRDNRYRDVLMKRYVDIKTWEQIAVEMAYTYRRITQLHGEALKAAEEYIHDKSL